MITSDDAVAKEHERIEEIAAKVRESIIKYLPDDYSEEEKQRLANEAAARIIDLKKEIR